MRSYSVASFILLNICRTVSQDASDRGISTRLQKMLAGIRCAAQLRLAQECPDGFLRIVGVYGDICPELRRSCRKLTYAHREPG